ncbi:MAG TPA: hypothetical protein VLH16_07120, partial [Bacteroidales bacterium]|nr:hypothetical protein [Bacteroidales bacterium]
TIVLILVFAYQANAQEAKDEAKAPSGTFTPYWFINGHLGFNQYFGDLNENRFYQSPDQWGIMGGVYFGRQFSPLFGLRGQLMYAGYNAEHADKDAYTEGNLFEYNINATISLLNLIRSNPDRKFDLYGFGGIGQFHGRSATKTISTDAPTHLNYFPDFGINGIGFGDRALVAVLPVGLGIEYSIAERWDVTLESSLRFTFTDAMDCWVAENNDMYGPTAIGITYKFLPRVDLSSMIQNFNTIQLTTTPEVLERHGDSVRVTIKGVVPEKYFHKRAAMVFQPVLRWDGGEHVLKPINLIGEDVVGDGQVINMREGGTFTYTATFPYKPEMAVSELVVAPVVFQPREPVKSGMTVADVKANETYVDGPYRKLVDGVIITSTRIVHDEKPVKTETGYVKETFVSEDATIYFQVNLHNLNLNLPLNRTAEARQAIRELEDFVRRGWKIRDIRIDAWASPEGEERFNQGLSERRAQTGLTYTHDMLRRLVRERNSLVKIADVRTDVNYIVNALGEDWDGFMRAVQASDIPDKNIIINVVNSQPDIQKREQEIRNMTIVYKEIEEDILPPLRRVLITVTAFEPKRTDDEIAKLATTDPGKLTEAELLHAATLTQDQAVQLSIYKNAINLFPGGYKAYNNAAVIELNRGNYSEAGRLLRRAMELGAGKVEVLTNMGILESRSKNFRQAETHFADARRLGADVNYNLGLIQIVKGDYNRALTYFSGVTCNYNVALAQLLAGNLLGANQNVKCAPETANTLYLQAIIAARTNDGAAVIAHLSKAIAADSAFKRIAVNDREFIRFINNPEFRALVN